MAFRIETIAIGDELLTGKISDTNSTFVAKELFSLGVVLDRVTVIADKVSLIKETISERSKHADAIICFGGLGPTTDDLTVDTVSELLGTSPVYHAGQRKKLEGIYNKREISLSDQALRQVRYPKSATAFANEVGLAPGFYCEIERCKFFFLPGVPAEMDPMVRGPVLKILRDQIGDTARVRASSWRSVGIPESEVQRRMLSIEKRLPEGVWVGYRTSYPENEVLLYEKGLKEGATDSIKQEISKALEDICYTTRFRSIEETVVETLREKKLSFAVAESCTGGLVVHRLTTIPGASDVVWGGLTTYQLAAKDTVLGVKLDDPKDAVSAACSLALAKKLKEKSRCDVVAAITGYMGPGGGTAEDPDGTIYTAVIGKEILENRFQLFRRERKAKQFAAATYLLDQIRRTL